MHDAAAATPNAKPCCDAHDGVIRLTGEHGAWRASFRGLLDLQGIKLVIASLHLTASAQVRKWGLDLAEAAAIGWGVAEAGPTRLCAQRRSVAFGGLWFQNSAVVNNRPVLCMCMVHVHGICPAKRAGWLFGCAFTGVEQWTHGNLDLHQRNVTMSLPGVTQHTPKTHEHLQLYCVSGRQDTERHMHPQRDTLHLQTTTHSSSTPRAPR